MHDYFGYPDATFDTPTKPCQYCNGKGWRKFKFHPCYPEKIIPKLPAFEKCITCNGQGVVDLNQE